MNLSSCSFHLFSADLNRRYPLPSRVESQRSVCSVASVFRVQSIEVASRSRTGSHAKFCIRVARSHTKLPDILSFFEPRCLGFFSFPHGKTRSGFQLPFLLDYLPEFRASSSLRTMVQQHFQDVECSRSDARNSTCASAARSCMFTPGSCSVLSIQYGVQRM